MAAETWAPGQKYPEGAVVRPLSLAAALFEAIKNQGFESALSNWTEVKTGTGTTTVVGTKPYTGSNHAKWVGSAGGAQVVLKNAAASDVIPGQTITVKAAFYCDNVTGSDNKAKTRIYWLDGTNAVLGFAESENTATAKAYTIISVTASAPSGTKHAQAALWMSANAKGAVYADAVSWATVDQSAATVGYVYKATQTGDGISGAAEPTWPTSGTVSDGTVTWTAVQASYVEWTASPILVSGATQPTWPTDVGASVSDGTITWTCSSRRVTDPKCPNSKVVAVTASKVFAAAKDLIRFSATNDPMDWSSEQDAGYLPSGLQQSNADDMQVLHPYRGNLVAFNANCFQLWQADPDPAQMIHLDQMDGVGSRHTLSACNVGNDLLYLAALGVRSIGVSIASQNMVAGDVGAPVDPMVQDLIARAIEPPVAAYYPSAGQYWLAVNTTNIGDSHGGYVSPGECTVMVYSMVSGGGKWSRYVYPFRIDEFCQVGDDLLIRTGRNVLKVDAAQACDVISQATLCFKGVVQWPWIDMGVIGPTKRLRGIDIVAEGKPSISVGFDQVNQNLFTKPYTLPADTLTGGVIPFSLAGPTFSLRVEFEAGTAWGLKSALLYVDDSKAQP